MRENWHWKDYGVSRTPKEAREWNLALARDFVEAARQQVARYRDERARTFLRNANADLAHIESGAVLPLSVHREQRRRECGGEGCNPDVS